MTAKHVRPNNPRELRTIPLDIMVLTVRKSVQPSNQGT